MLCKVCKTESPEGMKFCGSCGNNLEGKVCCQRCSKWINEEYIYCPYCSKKQHSTQEDAKEAQTSHQVNYDHPVNLDEEKHKIYTLITNTVVIALCLGLALILFGNVSNYKFTNNYQTIKSSANIINYVDAAFNGITDYTMNDFEREHEGNIERNNLNDINILNVLVTDDGEFIVQKVILYINFLIIVTMMVLPLVLLGLTINDFINLKRSYRYKSFFLASFILGFILVITTPLMSYKVGSATIIYILFSAVGLLYSYGFDMVTNNKKLNSKDFILKMISSLAFVLLIFIATTSIVKYDSNTYIQYGDFASIPNKFLKSNYNQLPTDTNFINVLTSDEMRQENEWAVYIGLLIPIFMVMTLGVLLAGLISEISSNFYNKKRKGNASVYAWLAFILEISIIIQTIFVLAAFKDFSNTFQDLRLGVGIIFLTILTFILALYRSVTSKLINE